MDKIIEILKYFLLGLVQGVAEVLPISSSGHLTIVNIFLKIEDNSVALNVFLHLASLIAILIFLRKELWYIIKGFFKYIFGSHEENKNAFFLAIYLVIATLPIVVFALILKLLSFDQSPLWLVGACLIVNAAMLFFLGKFTGTKKLEEMTWKDALVVGLFQCAGAFAGISRSGTCLCGCQVRKIEKNSSAKFAFLLFIPAAVGAMVLELKDMSQMVMAGPQIYLYLIAFVVAGVTTYFSFEILRKIISKGKITGFGFYCAAMGVFVVIYSILSTQ